MSKRKQPRSQAAQRRFRRVARLFLFLALPVLAGGLGYAYLQATAPSGPACPFAAAPRPTEAKNTLPGKILGASPGSATPASGAPGAPLPGMDAASFVDGGAKDSVPQARSMDREHPIPPPPFAGNSLEETAALLDAGRDKKAPVQWGESLPGITSRLPGAALQTEQNFAVALTLDACGGRTGASFDAGLIAFLREERIPATLFVTSSWMRANPEILLDLARDPLFEIAAHGKRHRPCSVNGQSVYGIQGTASMAELVEEVEGNARDIAAATGVRPRWFRSGTAFYDDQAVAAIRAMGFGIAGFSIAGDEGATLAAGRVAQKVRAAQHGDILLLHMNRPQSGTREGLQRSLPELRARGAVFIRLSDHAADW